MLYLSRSSVSQKLMRGQLMLLLHGPTENLLHAT